MIARLRLWFDTRTRREQRLLLVAAALAVLVLVWGVLALPFTDLLAAARARQAAAVMRLGQVDADIRALAALDRRPRTAPAVPLDAALRRRADDAGFALGEVRAAPGGVTLTIPSARPAALVAWLAALEADGMPVLALSMEDHGDTTVGAQVTIGAGS